MQLKRKGSLTVEAALVLPIFIFAIIVFMYFLQILFVQESIQAGLTEVAKCSCNYAYLYETIMEENKEVEDTTKNVVNQPEGSIDDSTDASEQKDSKSIDHKIIESLVDGTFYQMKLKDYVEPARIDRSCILGGYNGISFLYSTFLQDGETIDIVVVYRIRFPIPLFNLKDYTMVQRVRARGFVGEEAVLREGQTEQEDTKNNEQKVFITQTGTVYHLKRECTHLKLSIRNVDFQSVILSRNSSGGKYKACEVCCKKKVVGGSVYITTDGNRYHRSLNCSGLKRTILTVPISEVGTKKPCSRCGK